MALVSFVKRILLATTGSSQPLIIFQIPNYCEIEYLQTVEWDATLEYPGGFVDEDYA